MKKTAHLVAAQRSKASQAAGFALGFFALAILVGLTLLVIFVLAAISSIGGC